MCVSTTSHKREKLFTKENVCYFILSLIRLFEPPISVFPTRLEPGKRINVPILNERNEWEVSYQLLAGALCLPEFAFPSGELLCQSSLCK